MPGTVLRALTPVFTFHPHTGPVRQAFLLAHLWDRNWRTREAKRLPRGHTAEKRQNGDLNCAWRLPLNHSRDMGRKPASISILGQEKTTFRTVCGHVVDKNPQMESCPWPRMGPVRRNVHAH